MKPTLSSRRSIGRALALAAAWLVACSVARAAPAPTAPPPPLANAVILVIRHAEKPVTGDGLTPAGERRAAAYVAYFEKLQLDGAARPPDYLVATRRSKHSNRPVLTLQPLSAATGLAIHDAYEKTDTSALADALRAAPTGKTILICWHHENVPALLQALGASPAALLPQGTWPDGVYDWLIVLRYDASGQIEPARCERLDEHLMPGDPK